MPAAKLLIEFYFLRRAASPCVHGHKASNMGWGLCACLCVDTRTGCGLVERASASPCRHSPPPPVYSPIREWRQESVIALTSADHPFPVCYFTVSVVKYSLLSKI